MLNCPITYFEKNLIFDDKKQCWGVFELTGFHYDYLSEAHKEEILDKLTWFISSIVDEAKILMIPVIQNIDDHTKYLKRRVRESDPLYDLAVSHIEITGDYLKEQIELTGSTNDYKFYIVVKLVTEADTDMVEKTRRFFDTLFKDPVNAVNTAFATDTRDIMQSKVDYFERLANKFLKEQKKRVDIRLVSSGETQLLLKRVMRRGDEEGIRLNLTRRKYRTPEGGIKEVISEWTPTSERLPAVNKGDTIIRPFRRDTIHLFSGVVDRKTPRRLAVHHDDGTTVYQTFMVITHIPDVQEFPGSEWLYMLQKLACQCEVCIHIKNKENRQALRELDRQKRSINSQYDNITEAGHDVPEDLDVAYTDAGKLEGDLKRTRNPYCDVCVSIALSDTDPDELEARTEHVRQVYQDQNFVIERPAADQYLLFLQHIPGAGMYFKDFVMPLPPETVAGGIIGAKSDVGDNDGGYIGTAGTGKAVFLDPGKACQENKSASGIFMGDLGFGKSFNANLLDYLNVLLLGGYTLIFDPKGERTHWKGSLPIPQELISVVTVAPDKENAGKLDPFVMYRDNYDEAASLALTIIAELLKIKTGDHAYTVISECIEKMREAKKPSMTLLIQKLLNYDKKDDFYQYALQVGRGIKAMQNIGLSRLLFGKGDEEAIRLDNRINILQIQNMKMPDKGANRDNYTQDELMSSVIMIVLGHFAKQFALQELPFSQILFDESWMLGTTQAGIELFSWLARMGRSLNCGCIFNGHSMLDIPTEGIRNAITYAFLFHSGNTEECLRMLEFLEMDQTEENIQLIKGLKNRECLFKDLYGRVAKLTFDAVFEDIIEVFSTTPDAYTGEAEAVS